MKKIILTLLCVGVLGSFALAAQKNATSERHLAEKIGLGFNLFVLRLPELSARYWLTDLAGIEGFLGFRIDDNHVNKNRYIVGGKFLYVIKSYKNLNIFSNASMALYREKRTFGIIAGGIGVEWFVLDDLSLSTEAGLSFSIGGGGTNSIGTNVKDIPKISIKYYL
ncbi:MAG: hypothetical protein LBK92_00495 [Endomicrobium sp.]|jgi:hypothetical protein|nr:hypothetical protein [Endomicrobium sp.]